MMEAGLTAEAEMPRYQCHKKVWALRIKDIITDETGATIVPIESGCAPFSVPLDYVAKHQPKRGGYYVVYADGYKSYSPAEAFEEGYARIE